MFMDRDEVEFHKLVQKSRCQYQAILTEQAWSIKDLLYGFEGHFSCGTRFKAGCLLAIGGDNKVSFLE